MKHHKQYTECNAYDCSDLWNEYIVFYGAFAVTVSKVSSCRVSHQVDKGGGGWMSSNPHSWAAATATADSWAGVLSPSVLTWNFQSPETEIPLKLLTSNFSAWSPKELNVSAPNGSCSSPSQPSQINQVANTSIERMRHVEHFECWLKTFCKRRGRRDLTRPYAHHLSPLASLCARSSFVQLFCKTASVCLLGWAHLY